MLVQTQVPKKNKEVCDTSTGSLPPCLLSRVNTDSQQNVDAFLCACFCVRVILRKQVIDEDTLRNRRPESMSVSVHGVQALFVKPAQSLAPMLGVACLPGGALKTDLADMSRKQVRRLCLLYVLRVVCYCMRCLKMVGGTRGRRDCTGAFKGRPALYVKSLHTRTVELAQQLRNWRHPSLFSC